jgi:hypothetical protein
MPDSALLTGLTGAGAAGIFCILFIAGFIYPRPVVTDLKTEIGELKAALEAERQRAAASIAAATATRDVLAAIQAARYLEPEHKQ